MTDETSPSVHRRSLLLGSAGVGAALAAMTAADLLEFPAAAAGATTTKHFHGTFANADTADWHYLPFTMPKGVRELRVHYDFRPHDTGLGYSTNVVDIGLFDPSGKGLGDTAGFRGWSGGARRHLRVNHHWATPGYLAGPLTPGRWHVILGPFLIVPPGTPWKVRVTMVHGDPVEPAFVADHAPVAVPGSLPGWYRGDLHLHSIYSDGQWTPSQLVAQAQANGLDFMGTSDHNTNAATRVFGRYVPDDFLVISGEEVTTRNGHWLATGTMPGTWIDWRYRRHDHELGHFADLTRSRGGVAVAAHPFVPIAGTRWDFNPSYQQMDAVEVWNGPWSAFNQRTVDAWQVALVGGRFTPAVGNSDSHHSGQVVGLPQTVYRAAALSTEAILDALRGGHCWVAESAAVQLTFTGTGSGATTTVGEAGDTVALTPGEHLVCHLDVTGVPNTIAQLVGTSGVIAHALADGTGHLVLDAPAPAGEGFIRAEVRRTNGVVADPTTYQSALPMVALTNPVFTR